MSIQRTTWPPGFLLDSDTHNGRAALSDIPRSLAGVLAVVEGHTMGGALTAGAPNPAGLNPFGERGHAHTGGLDGTPFHHSIASIWLGDPGADYDMTSTTMGYITGTNADDSETTYNRGSLEIPVFVPPCDPSPTYGAYVRLGWYIRYEIDATTLLAGDTLKVVVEQRTPGLIAESGTPIYRASSAAASAPNSTGEDAGESSTDETILAVPGRVNVLGFGLSVVRTTGGGTRQASVFFHELELGVHGHT